MNIFKFLFSRKYRVFKKKIKDVETSIWEYEFKIAKSRQVREGVRQDRDRSVESAKIIETHLKTETDKEKIKALTAELEKHADNAKRYEAQMKMIDEQISGVGVRGEDAGQQGILDIIASLTELRTMYIDYLRTI